MTLLLGSDSILGKFLSFRLDGEIDNIPIPTKRYDVVYCCDKQQSVIDVLNTLSCERLIFFSDYSIYNNNTSNDHYEWLHDPFEEDANDSSVVHKIELAVTSKFGKYNIIRLPDQIIGTGIKTIIDKDKSIYDLDELLTDITKVIRAEIHVCNFTSQMLSTNINNVKTRYSWLFPDKSAEGYTLNSEYVKGRCDRYIKVLNSDKSQFAVADKCWKVDQSERKVINFLNDFGITNIEVDLLSRFEKWGKINLYSVRNFARELRVNNLNIWAFNNNFTDIAFTLFDDKSETILNHTIKLIDFCTVTGARRINFDNPDIFNIRYCADTMYNVREKAAKSYYQFLQKLSTYKELSNFKDIVLCFPHIDDVIPLLDTYIGVLKSTNSENIKLFLNSSNQIQTSSIDKNVIGTIRIDPKNNKDIIKVDRPKNKVTIMTEKVYKLDTLYNMIGDTINMTEFYLEP